ncbi:MAG: transcriptional repressor LexA [Acidobacteria bacterium]|jgi:repressor LexA|nr:transcriptional repressor LexA [Acidobacteriota bacterium]
MGLTRRQKEILDFVREFIEKQGYSPSLDEIGRHFGLSSVATVHKHVTNLVQKGLLRRVWNQNRSLEVVREDDAPRAAEVPVLGRVGAGARALEVPEDPARLEVPCWMVGRGRMFAMRVDGDALIDEQIRDGDYVVIEERWAAEAGRTVLALVAGDDAAVRRIEVDGSAARVHGGPRRTEPQVLPLDKLAVRGVVRGVLRRC